MNNEDAEGTMFHAAFHAIMVAFMLGISGSWLLVSRGVVDPAHTQLVAAVIFVWLIALFFLGLVLNGSAAADPREFLLLVYAVALTAIDAAVVHIVLGLEGVAAAAAMLAGALVIIVAGETGLWIARAIYQSKWPEVVR